MILRYGSYSHANNECAVIISRDGTVGEDGKVVSVTERWDIAGQYHADSVSALTAGLRAMERAYQDEKRDLVLKTDAGGATAHGLYNSQTMFGVRVVQPPSYPVGSGAEYTTFRNYTIAVEAEFAVNSGLLLSYREGVTQRGSGAALWTYQFPILGPPQPQILSQYSPVTIVQEGRAVGFGVYPPFPPPMWSTQELGEQRQLSREIPAKGSFERVATWSYTYLFYAPQDAYPNIA